MFRKKLDALLAPYPVEVRDEINRCELLFKNMKIVTPTDLILLF